MPTIEVKAKGSDVSYVLATITEEEFNKIVDSLLYNVRSQQFLVHLHESVRDSEDFKNLRENDNDAAVQKIREISAAYNANFGELAGYVEKWYPRREYLIKILNLCAEKLDFDFTLVSWIRIVAAAADLAANVARIRYESDLTIAGFSVGNLSIIGLISLFLQKARAKSMVDFVKKTFDKDLEILEKIRGWFKQTEELDRAVKSFFPYGIDEEVARKVHQYTEAADEFSKIFMSVVASNVKKDITLCKDQEFLDKAELFASSEAGLLWFHKIILEKDPVFIECLSVAQEIKIQNALKMSSDVNQADVCLNFPMQMCKQKAALDAVNIYLTTASLLDDGNKEKSDPFRELAEKAKEELQHIDKLVHLFRPCVILNDL